jgi:hypothetical protein
MTHADRIRLSLVGPDVAWLSALSERAQLASAELW